MKKQTMLGKVIFLLGFLLFIFGVIFNKTIGVISDGPIVFSSLSIPGITIGIVLIIISHFFKRNE